MQERGFSPKRGTRFQVFSGTRSERIWNAFGTRSERVPDAFRTQMERERTVRLFLSSTVQANSKLEALDMKAIDELKDCAYLTYDG